MSPDNGLTPADLRELKESVRSFITAIDRTAPMPAVSNSNTNNINMGSLVAAWISSICCAIVLTIVVLSRIDQVDQGRKIDRLQDHETIILQYAPQLRDKLLEMDKGKK